jgi:hypothetical protein
MARRHNRNMLCCALASCLAVAAPAAFAQSTAATIRGQVLVDSAPAASAQVTATNLATGLKRTVQAGSNGSYSVAGLPPGTYRIDVTAGGRTNSKDVTLQVGQTATLNLGVGGVAESPVAGDATTLGTVLVTAPAFVETKTSEVATYVTQKQIDALPQASRNFLAFADIVPGMVFSTLGGDGSTKLRGGAQSSNGINVFIDGVGQKNYVVKGGITGQDTSRGNPFPQLGIAEYKVITSNYKAEFDQVSSAAVTAVTRSGTNEFKGNVFGDYTNQDWRAPTVVEDKNGAKTPSFEKEYGVALGGPIILDRLHYFFTYERKDFSSPREFRPGQNFTVAQLPTDLQALASSTSSAPFKEDLYFAKLDWEPGDNHLFELSAKYRKEDELTGIGGTRTAAGGTLKTGKDTRLDLRYQYSAERWLNDAHLTFEDSSFGPRPATIGPGYQLTGNLQMTPANPGQVILNAGGGRDFQDKGQKGTSLQDDLTFTDIEWKGRHTIKMGLKYKTIDINAFEQSPFNPQFSYDINNSLTIPYHVEFGAVTGGGSRNITTSNKQFGTYIQDDWEVNEHLLLNLGLRWDYEQTPGYTHYVTPPALVAALQGWSNIHQPGVDYNINDYISNGHNRKDFKKAWQPRLGFSYDINADQRHVIFGGAGRSYDRNLFDYLAAEQSKSTFPTYNFDINSPGHPCVVGPNCLAFDPALFDPATLAALVAANPNLGAEVNLINNNLKTPYSDQFSLGMRNAFPMWGNDWNTTLTLAHIVSHDGIVFAPGGRRPDGTFFPPGKTFGCCEAYDFPIPGYGRLFIASNGIETKLNTLLFSLEKPYTRTSGWGMTVAYTFSAASENHINAYQRDDTFVGDYANLNGAPFTRTVGLARHRLVMTGIYDGLWGMTFSSKLTLASPTPLESLNCFTIDGNNCYWDPLTPKGTIGYKQFDLAVQKEWNVGSDVKFRVRGDLLNAFNWRNYTDYDTWHGFTVPGGPSFPELNYGNRSGDGIAFPTRMFKLTAGLSW